MIVHTGKGKGKSTAAWEFAVAARSGVRMRAGVVQFGKGSWDTGERTAVARFGATGVARSARASPGDAGPRARHRRCRARVDSSRGSGRPSIRLLILDELNISLRYAHLALGEVVATLGAAPGSPRCRHRAQREAELIDAADLVTEMVPVKHHFAAGVKAQEGIEF